MAMTLTFAPGTVPAAPQETLARRGMVAAAHPIAARIGRDILQKGGNAIDAMVAVQMALNVVEPEMSGLGGGCFILYHDARAKETFCIDGREEIPANSRRTDFLDDQGKPRSNDHWGGVPVGVPGTVSAMWLAHGRWGKLPIAQLLEPARNLAEKGVGITPLYRKSIVSNQRRFLLFPASRALFLRPDGSPPELGEVIRNPDLARTLDLLAREGPRAFYEGEIARDIVHAIRSAAAYPGRMTAEDLQGYRAVFREPVRFTYRGHELVSAPPPSSGGLTLGLLLGIVATMDPVARRPGSLEELDLFARAGAAAFADRNAYLGDQDWNPALDMRALLQPGRVKERALAARSAQAGERMPAGPAPLVGSAAAWPGNFEGNPREGMHTTHFSIVDEDRNVVACTTTIESVMGSGLVVAGRGFLLNNQLTDFNVDQAEGPNAPDTTRRPRRTALTDNQAPAGKRPRSSMTPVIVFKNGMPVAAVGSPGGAYIIGVVGQVLVNILDHDMPMQQAINAPRVNCQNGPVELESYYANRAALVRDLKSRGWTVRERMEERTYGAAQGIRILPDGGLQGGADPRREGAVRGF